MAIVARRVTRCGFAQWTRSASIWFHNLRTNPQVTVEVGNERFDERARVAANDERDRLWQEFKVEIPALADYEQKTSREIPVVVLERVA